MMVATHNNIRKSLFYQAFRIIRYVEYGWVLKEGEFFEFKSFKDTEERMWDYIMDSYFSKVKNDWLIGV